MIPTTASRLSALHARSWIRSTSSPASGSTQLLGRPVGTQHSHPRAHRIGPGEQSTCPNGVVRSMVWPGRYSVL